MSDELDPIKTADAMLQVLEPFVNGMVQRHLDDEIADMRSKLKYLTNRLRDQLADLMLMQREAESLLKLLGAMTGVEGSRALDALVDQRVKWNMDTLYKNAHHQIDTLFNNYTYLREEGDN